MKKRWVWAILFVFSITINSAHAGDEILLKSRRFIPERGITAAARAKIEAIPGKSHVLVQLGRIPTIKERKELEAKGIELLSYVPNRAWFASIPSDKAGEVAAITNVRAISEILPEDKIAPAIRENGVNAYSTNDKNEAKLAVLFFRDVSLAEASVIIAYYGGTVITEVPPANALVIFLPKDLIHELAGQDTVCWIDQHYEPAIANDGSRAAIGADIVQGAPYNLTGTGVIAGEWDGGCVHGHDDLAGRVIPRNCEGGGYEWHATHVAGTMLGNGSRSESQGGSYLQWKGMATNAAVISYLWWTGIDEVYSDYNEAINSYGIDLSNNSWGHLLWSEYNAESQAEDKTVRGACGKRIPIMWGAGNEGPFWRSIRSNGVAKNIVTVGATNSNDDSMYVGSSRGPTADGRIKPDIVAPGCQDGGDAGITSTYPVNVYASLCGTSMATPAVSGSVALMLEDWRNIHTGEPDPLPSTIKAILIQTAVDLCNIGPDYSCGYGRIDVNEAIGLIRSGNIIEDSIIEQNDNDYFVVAVPQGQPELRITLVWDDYPAEPLVSKALVNDLDLIVRDPNGTRYYPWTLNPDEGHEGDLAMRVQEDHLNNVEQVYVANPVSGAWTIEISETNIPEPAQDYSLASNRNLLKLFDINKADNVPDGNSVMPGNTITYTISYNYRSEPNIGNINSVNIIDYLPDEVDYNSSSPVGVYSASERTVTWNIGTLSPGEAGSVALTVKVNKLAEPLGTITNRAIMTTGIGRVSGIEVTDVNMWNPLHLRIIKTSNVALGDCNEPNDIITYTITYDANGHSDANVVITDFLPQEVDFISASHGGYNGLLHAVVWNVGTVGPSDTNSTNIVVRVNTLAEPLGTIRNYCVMEGDATYVADDIATPVCGWHPDVIYVDDTAGDANTGMSWENAYLDLNDALHRARRGCGNQIWVAAGTYRPISVSSPFSLVSGVPVYGGFAGYETSIEQRDLHNPANETILNGLIGGNNATYVVTATNANSATIFDNFTVIEAVSAGIYINGGSPIIRNCRIHHNQDTGLSSGNANVRIDRCTISDNDYQGIAVSNASPQTVNILNNIIHHNGNDGLNVSDYWMGATQLNVRNNTIMNNTGAGVNVSVSLSGSVTNCIVQNNQGGDVFGRTLSYSRLTGDGDPCFVAAEANDFHLKAESLCIDAGEPNSTEPNELDIDGEPRLADGNCDANTVVDIGADEVYWPACWSYLTQCHGDADGDGNVDTDDWPPFRDGFGKTYPHPRYIANACADYNRDGVIDTVDWPEFRDNFGKEVEANCACGGTWPPEQQGDGLGGGQYAQFGLESAASESAAGDAFVILEMIDWLDEVWKSGQLDIPEDEYLAFRKVVEEQLQ